MTGVTTSNKAPADMRTIPFQQAIDHLESMRVREVKTLGFTEFHRGDIEGIGSVVLCIDASSESAMLIH